MITTTSQLFNQIIRSHESRFSIIDMLILISEKGRKSKEKIALVYNKAVRSLKSFSLIFIAFLILAFSSQAWSESPSKVLVAEVEGVIDPVTASYFKKAISRAEQGGYEALIVKLDTPGGLDESMREIVKAELNSKVPVIIYVHPSGARAASAGVFIALASHIAVMTPGTNIGAAHPVGLGGEIDETMKEKVTNDAASYIKGLAKKRGRNEEWAEEAVRKSSSVTAEEALKKGVIDFMAENLDELLRKVDGRKVEVEDGKVVLKTKGVRVEHYPMNWRERLLHALSNPNLAYLLLTLGFYGIIYELANPGFGFAGIGGALCLILAFYSFQVLPVNYAGLALIIFALILFVAEAMTPTFGVLTLGGIISFVLGSLILIESPIPAIRVSLWMIIPTALISFTFVFLATRAVIKTHKRKSLTGKEGMVGLIGEARTELNPEGQVFVRGEIWKAESLEGVIEEGEKIQVVEVEGLKLKVKRKEG